MQTNYQGTSMLDMVFENRNKAYGAYVLRRDYDKSLRAAMIFSFGSVLILVLFNFIAEHIKRTARVEPPIIVEVHPSNLPPELLQRKQAVVPPPRPRVQAANKATIKNTEMKVVTQSEVTQDSIPATQELAHDEPGINSNAGAGTSGVAGGNGDAPGLDPPAEAIPAAPTVFRWVEVMPEFPGGEKKLRRFLSENTEYPPMEKEIGLNAKVVAEFTVNEDGHASDIKILKSGSPGFDKEVIRVIKLMPSWKPGLQQNKPVKVRMVLPFTFRVN